MVFNSPIVTTGNSRYPTVFSLEFERDREEDLKNILEGSGAPQVVLISHPPRLQG
jgi:hypothetical protein